jgi:hypothetical protein
VWYSIHMRKGQCAECCGAGATVLLQFDGRDNGAGKCLEFALS